MDVDFQTKLLHIQKLFSETLQIAQKISQPDDVLQKKISNSYKRALNQKFQIAVMAMAKSGKSTFLNALLGNEFLSVSNKPETAIPVKIVHSNEHSEGLLYYNDEPVAKGVAEINYFIKQTNEKRREELSFNSSKHEVAIHTGTNPSYKKNH